MALSKRDRYIRSALRKIWYWSPERREALKNAESVVAGKKVYRCAECGKKRRRSGIAIDHRMCVVPPDIGFTDYDTYIRRMFCSVDGLQVLCKTPCHQKKTKAESKERRKARAKAKSKEKI